MGDSYTVSHTVHNCSTKCGVCAADTRPYDELEHGRPVFRSPGAAPGPVSHGTTPSGCRVATGGPSGRPWAVTRGRRTTMGFRGTESNAKTVLCTRCELPRLLKRSAGGALPRRRDAQPWRWRDGNVLFLLALYPPQLHVPGGLPLRRPLQLRAWDGGDQVPAGGGGGTRSARHARCGANLGLW